MVALWLQGGSGDGEPGVEAQTAVLWASEGTLPAEEHGALDRHRRRPHPAAGSFYTAHDPHHLQLL